jgi:hypothetical protein
MHRSPLYFSIGVLMIGYITEAAAAAETTAEYFGGVRK